MKPIRHTLRLSCPPARAFAVFTTGMGSWWDPAYTPDAATFTGVDVAPRVGASVALRHGDAAYPIGEVTAWEPGTHYAQTFTLAMDAAQPSTLDVRFAPDGDGCRVEFAHGGWTAANEAVRSKYGDWPHLLARYAEAADRA